MSTREEKVDKVAKLAASAVKSALGLIDTVGETVNLLGEEVERHFNEVSENLGSPGPDPSTERSFDHRRGLRHINLGAGWGSISLRRDYRGEVYVNAGLYPGESYHVQVEPGCPPKVTKLDRED